MDPQELERRKQEARDEGYSEEEINAALGLTPQAAAPGAAPQASAPVAPNAPYTPPPDQTVDRSAEKLTTAGAGAAAGAAAVGLPAALAYAVKRGVGAGAQAMDVAKQGINAMQEQNAVARAHQQLQYDKMAARGQVPGAAPGPVAPAQSPILGPNGQPLPAAQPQPRPTMPPPAAAAAAEATQMTAARNIVQKLALDKVLKGAGLAGAAYELGKNLFTTSPEEIAILKRQEAERRAKGWRPLNER